MDNSTQMPALRTDERIQEEVRRLEWAKGLREETLTAITDAAEWVEFQPGQVVIELDSEITHMFFLITGRLHATLFDVLGKEIQKDTFVRGSVIGLFSLGLSERSHLQVQATEPATAIRLTLPELLKLTAQHPDFQMAVFRLAANIFKRYVTVDRTLPKPSVVGVVHHTEASRPFTAHLARRLRDLDESPAIVGDDERWKPDRDIPFRMLVGEGRVEDRPRILKDLASHKRLLVDVRADHSTDAMIRFLSYVDIVLWCVRPQDTGAAVDRLQELEKSVPGWRQKLRIAWLLDNDNPFAPHVPEFV